MSLRSFHLVFVTFCLLLFAFLAIWAFWLAEDSSMSVKVLGGLGVLGCLLTPVYGVYFLRKVRNLPL